MKDTWWSIRYFNRAAGYTQFDSSMVPFKLLPELKNLDVKLGHRFHTDQFEITIPGSNITLHMPSRSIWIDNKPRLVKDATRVVLFIRSHATNSELVRQEVSIGLLNDLGYGLIVKYRMDDKTHTVQVMGRSSIPKVTEPPEDTGYNDLFKDQ